MKPRVLVAFAGIPQELHEGLAKKTSGELEIIAFEPLDETFRYTRKYCGRLYSRFAANLRKRDLQRAGKNMVRTNLVLLYVDLDEDSVNLLHDFFGIEVLLLPLQRDGILDVALETKNQINGAVNALIASSKKEMKRANVLLFEIDEEIHKRESRTCLLLPPKNYGKDFEKISRCVHHATRTGQDGQEFKKSLNSISGQLKTKRENKRTYFVGRRKLVFKSPSKSGPRHGFVRWDTEGHQISCVIRGMLRFGTVYDPGFHFDCDLSGKQHGCFPNCHGYKKIPKSRSHLNISPNDHVR